MKPERQKWFGCACCPPNIIRLLSSLEDYAYSVNGRDVYVHLYVGGGLEAEADGRPVRLDVKTDYPWDGAVKLTVGSGAAFALKLRVPGWCRRWTLRVNGEEARPAVRDGYLSLDREWSAGDAVELDLDMPVALVRANPCVREDAGMVAVARGPLVYCLEEADNGRDLHLARLGDARPEDFAIRWKPDKLGGIAELACSGLRETDAGWGDTLYSADAAIENVPARLTWIPYYSWANREPGEMRVWIRR